MISTLQSKDPGSQRRAIDKTKQRKILKLQNTQRQHIERQVLTSPFVAEFEYGEYNDRYWT